MPKVRLSRGLLLVLAAAAAGCPAEPGAGIRVGVDAALEEVGLAPWLEASFERDTGARAEIRLLSPLRLAQAAREGELDEVLLGSTEALEALRADGLLAEVDTVAHEELLLVGPAENVLGKYAHTRGAELLKNLARTNHIYLQPAPDSVEGLRHRRLFRETGDHVKPGAWFATKLRGVELVRSAVQRHAFTLVRRSSLLLAAREGVMPGRIWSEGDPALVLELVAGRVHPGRTKREDRGAFHAWITGPKGRAALESFGQDRLGHPIYALGAPPPGAGASTAPLEAWIEARLPEAETSTAE